MELRPPLHLGVVAIEKRTSRSPSTKVTNFTLHLLTGPLVWWLECSPGYLSSISGRVIPKTQKMVLDVSLLYTHHYKIRLKGKWTNPGNGVVSQLNFNAVAIEKGAIGSTSTSVV